MQNNPFESGHIKNYILLYASIVAIMILFFFASDLFIEQEEVITKVFNSDTNRSLHVTKSEEKTKEAFKPKFKVLEKAY